MSKIKEKTNLTFEGILNLEDMNIEVENFENPVDLDFLLKPYDGQSIKVSINIIKDINEE